MIRVDQGRHFQSALLVTMLSRLQGCTLRYKATLFRS